MTRDEVLTKLRALKPTLERRYGITRLRLFGSHARDEARPDSDVDLVVDLRQPLGLQFFGIEQDIAQYLGVKVDVATPNGLHRLIRNRALAEAVDV